MSFVMIDPKRLKPVYKEFQQEIALFENEVHKRAGEIWGGWHEGADLYKLGNKEYGKIPILPRFLTSDGTTVLNTFVFDKSAASVGWNDIMLTPTTTALVEDIILAIVGFAFPNPEHNISKFRIEIKDRKYPVLNVEQLEYYEVPAIIIKKGFIVEEKETFKLRAYITLPSIQKIIPLGFLLFKRLDLVINE